MRYYSLQIEGGPTYTSLVNGITDPGALNIEMDVSVTPNDVPQGTGYIRVWGLGLPGIAQTANLVGKKLTVSGGMAPGLPLANPAQAGVLFSGYIQQCFGNWIGVDQTLDMMIWPGSDPPAGGGPNPKVPTRNLPLDWKKGDKLNDALKQCLQTGFPGCSINMNIAGNIIADQDQKSYFNTLEELAYYLRRYSQKILGPNSQGVSIVMPQVNQFSIFDGGFTGGGQVQYQDLIGQPTWIEPQTIQFKTVMRADLKCGNNVTLPTTFANQTFTGPAGGASNVHSQLAFSGTFVINTIRQVGSYRQPTAEAWVSIFNCSSAGTV